MISSWLLCEFLVSPNEFWWVFTPFPNTLSASAALYIYVKRERERLRDSLFSLTFSAPILSQVSRSSSTVASPWVPERCQRWSLMLSRLITRLHEDDQQLTEMRVSILSSGSCEAAHPESWHCDSGGFDTTKLSGKIFCVEIYPSSTISCLSK